MPSVLKKYLDRITHAELSNAQRSAIGAAGGPGGPVAGMAVAKVLTPTMPKVRHATDTLRSGVERAQTYVPKSEEDAASYGAEWHRKNRQAATRAFADSKREADRTGEAEVLLSDQKQSDEAARTAMDEEQQRRMAAAYGKRAQ